MHYLTERIATAHASAAAAAGDIRIKEFLQSMQIFTGPSGTTPKGVWIDCHERFWFRTLIDSDFAALETLSPAELPNLVTGWVQEAIHNGLLSLSNPPEYAYCPTSNMLNAPSPVGFAVTYVYNEHGNVIRRIKGEG